MESCNSEENNSFHLQPSELGTKEYWNAVYERDKRNYETHGDAGEIWFGEDIEIRILRWLKKNVDVKQRIIDIGCGNGMMLIDLAREGYEELTGVDYSAKAIELCTEVMKAQHFHKITLKLADLTEQVNDLKGFNVALDKGTFDAISLNPDNAISKQKKYITNIYNLLSADGMFIITSCNWTEQEIIKQFQSELTHFYTIPTPTFMFGGKVGNVVSSVVFKKIC